MPASHSDMAATDSDDRPKSGRHAIGTGGRHPSERVAAMRRNGRPPWPGVRSKGKGLSIFAHKIARAVYFMLKRNEAFDVKRFFATA